MTASRLILMVTLTLSLLAAPLAAAQQVGKVWRIGFLSAGSRPSDGVPPASFRHGLNELGYVDGMNVTYAGRWAVARSERLPELAAELVALKVDLIVAGGWPAAEAARQATATIPIVILLSGDAVGVGLVPSLARPGGNLTGISDQSVELSAKRLELLKEAAPNASRIAVLWNTEDRAMTLRYREIESAARVLRVVVQPLGVREPNDFDAAFSAMTRDRPDALFMVTDALTSSRRRQVIEFAAAHRIPAMYEFASFVQQGGLMSFGSNVDWHHRRAAVYVDRILKGARPADLPVEQPTKFELIINLKTAKHLGLTIAPSLLLRADAVIE